MTTSAATFVFADIAGFTALTEAHGDEEAVELVTRFAEAVEAELPAVGGRHVEKGFREAGSCDELREQVEGIN